MQEQLKGWEVGMGDVHLREELIQRESPLEIN